jgi:hypothetical protein
MPWWAWLLDAAGVLLLLAVLYVISLVLRRRWISRDGGTFDFSVRVRSAKAGRGWVLGVGRYSGDVLEWFRIFSLAPGPKLRLSRTDLEYVGRREPEGAESFSLYSGHTIVLCEGADGRLEISMSPPALTGFLAWLEAAPPGRRVNRR